MQTKQFKTFPKAYQAYPKIATGLVRTQLNKLLKKHSQSSADLPQLCYQVNDFLVDEEHLQAFRQICGYHEYNHDHAQIPAIYLVVLAQSVQMQMMSAKDFPFEVLGLIHTANKIKQIRPLLISEKLTLSCQFGEMREHEKGIEFSFIIDVQVNHHSIIQAETTYLAPQRRKGAKTQTSPIDNPYLDYTMKNTWYLSESLGRRYATVSGDFNPIHLHAKTAQLFGFKQAIAHGMWTNAKVLANLELTPAYSIDVQFKLPIFLPSKIDLMLKQNTDSTDIIVRAHDTHKPHLVAQLHAL